DTPATTEEHEPAKSSYETSQSAFTITPRDITLVFPPTLPIYVDTGIQPSPPASPVLPTMAEASSQTVDEPLVQPKPVESPPTHAEIDSTQSQANQRRKRTSLLLESSSPAKSGSSTSCTMTSSAVQTAEQPLSPPPTPKIGMSTDDLPATPVSPVFKTDLVSSSTQTEPVEEADILNRPFRTSSLFAGFDGPSSDEEDFADNSDDEYRSQPYATPMLSSRNA
nr:hypothetical protein [Tanacetum cinerariifolium]